MFAVHQVVDQPPVVCHVVALGQAQGHTQDGQPE